MAYIDRNTGKTKKEAIEDSITTSTGNISSTLESIKINNSGASIDLLVSKMSDYNTSIGELKSYVTEYYASVQSAIDEVNEEIRKEEEAAAAAARAAYAKKHPLLSWLIK